MIDSATGMRPGQRYTVQNLERTKNFGGFFLDGKYYLGPELMTAVGWLEGQNFLYDELDANGEPVFPDRVAGTIEDLTLVLNDGARLELQEMQVDAPMQAPESAPASQRREETVRRKTSQPPYLLIATGAALLVAGIAIARACRMNTQRRR